MLRFLTRLFLPLVIAIVLLFGSDRSTFAVCQGRVQCLYQDGYGVCGLPQYSSQGYASAGTPAACAALEVSLIDSCEGLQTNRCANGGCYWTDVCGDGMYTGSENSVSCLSDCAGVPPPPLPPPGCNPNSWTDVDCGLGSCSSSQMQQRRTYSPAGCNPDQYQCVADASCTPGIQSCHFAATPPTININGSPVTVTSAAMSVVPDVGTIADVTFSSIDTSIATVTSPDGIAPYRTNATSVAGSAGKSTPYVVTANMSDGLGQCVASGTINVTNLSSWFQIGSNITAKGNVRSMVSDTCVGTPGLAISGGNIVTRSSPGPDQ